MGFLYPSNSITVNFNRNFTCMYSRDVNLHTHINAYKSSYKIKCKIVQCNENFIFVCLFLCCNPKISNLMQIYSEVLKLLHTQTY